jgi:hypothetical protein
MMTGVESPAMNLFMLDLHAPIRCCNRLMAASGVRPNGPFLPSNSTRSDVSQTAANAMGGAECFFTVGRAAVVARPLPPAVAAATSRAANDLIAIDLTRVDRVGHLLREAAPSRLGLVMSRLAYGL